MKRPRFFMSGVIILVLSLLLLTNIAQAGWSSCRSDPIVHLSNGQKLSLSVGIETRLQNVDEIHYTLHVPAGVTVIRVVGTPKWPDTIETFTFVQDSAPGEYHTETIVHTSEEAIPVTAWLRVMGVGDNNVISQAGIEDETVHLYLPIP